MKRFACPRVDTMLWLVPEVDGTKAVFRCLTRTDEIVHRAGLRRRGMPGSYGSVLISTLRQWGGQ